MKGIKGVYSFLVAFTLAAFALVSPALAQAPTVPDVGVDLADWMPVIGTAFGTIVAAAVAGYFAFLIVKKGLAWGRKALG